MIKLHMVSNFNRSTPDIILSIFLLQNILITHCIFPFQVIPQLIARIDTPRTLVSRLIHHLLMDIGKQHPQALVYPLTVAGKSNSLPRRNAATTILTSMYEDNYVLVQQAYLVS